MVIILYFTRLVYDIKQSEALIIKESHNSVTTNFSRRFKLTTRARRCQSVSGSNYKCSRFSTI